jgi:hypothetical protein
MTKYRYLEHLQEFGIFYSPKHDICQLLNNYREEKKRSSPIVPHNWLPKYQICGSTCGFSFPCRREVATPAPSTYVATARVHPSTEQQPVAARQGPHPGGRRFLRAWLLDLPTGHQAQQGGQPRPAMPGSSSKLPNFVEPPGVLRDHFFKENWMIHLQMTMTIWYSQLLKLWKHIRILKEDMVVLSQDKVIYRDREGGHKRMFQDYLADDPTYAPHLFHRRLVFIHLWLVHSMCLIIIWVV